MPEASAKDILVKPIEAAAANAFVRRVHYSGKVVRNSQIHLGVFLNARLEGVMQFGPSMDKRRMLGLVAGTTWNGFLELNRLAFTDYLPRNSESRALAVAFRIIRKRYPFIKWVVSFADACQCGDGTIYRAAGFVLTQVKKNTTIWTTPDGTTFSDLKVRTGPQEAARVMSSMTLTKGSHISPDGKASMARFREAGARPLEGFQIRYIYFLDPEWRSRLTVPELPFSEIERLGASMYRAKRKNAAEVKEDTPGFHPGKGGATPTRPLQLSRRKK